MHIAPGGLQLKTCFYSTSYINIIPINIISKLCCFVLNFAGITTALWHCSLVLCKENPYLFSQPDTGQTVQGFSRLAPCNSEPSLHYYSYAPFQMPPTKGTYQSGNQCTLLLHSAPGRSLASDPQSQWLLCWGSLKGCPTHSHSGLQGHCLGEDRGAVGASAQPPHSSHAHKHIVQTNSFC